MTIAAFLFAYLGFAGLSLAMRRHFHQVFPERRALSKRHVFILRLSACLILALSLTFCIAAHGNSVGIVYWFGLMTLAVLTQSLVLSYTPRWAATIPAILIIPALLAVFASSHSA
jgi:hypothetical protein